MPTRIPRSKWPVSMSLANSAFDDFEEGRMEPVSVWSRPLLVLEVERKSAGIQSDQFGHLIRAGYRRQRLEESPTLVAATGDQVAIQPDQIRVMVQVAGRQVVDVLLLKDTAEEIDGLVERIDGIERIEIGPQRIENLVARRRQFRPREQKAQESEDLSPNRRARDLSVSDANRHSVLVLDVHPISQPPSQGSTESTGPRAISSDDVQRIGDA